MSPIWTLVPVSVLVGALMMWIFRQITDSGALRQTINRIVAHLLEFWIFVDEPALIWKSWRDLLIAGARLYRLLLAPLLIFSVLALPLFWWLDAAFGSSPLPIGKTASVTLGMNRTLDSLSTLPQLKTPDGISLESPAVRVFSRRQVSWRIRPLRPVSGQLEWLLAGAKVQKSVAAGSVFGYHSSKRTRSLVELLRYPAETRLPAGPVEWIEISYPSATVGVIGMEAHWSIWFVAFSLLGAMVTGLWTRRSNADPQRL